jgi:O-antigen/teichoic acid export membrane protein
MDKVSVAETIGRLVLFLGILLSARFDWGLWGVMLSISAGGGANFLLHLIFSLSHIKVGLEFDLSLWREALLKSWPLALTIVFNLLYLKTDIIILSLIKNQTDVGIYGAAYKVIDILTSLPFMFAGVIVPILTVAWLENRKEYFQKVFQKSFDLMVILAMPLAVGAQFAAGPVMKIVAGQEFNASGPVLRILMVAVALVFLSCLLSHVMVSMGRQKEIIGSYFFTAITSVAAYLFFIPKYSYFGAAAVTIYSELAITVFMFYYLWKYGRIFPRLKIFGQSFLAAVVMGGAFFLLKDFINRGVWQLFGSLFAASAVYFIFLYFFGALNKQDFSLLLKKKI